MSERPSLRILLVTHAPLSPDFGAAQAALNLGQALRDLGHDVSVWSPYPLEQGRSWWRQLPEMRSKLRAFIAAQPAFDVIDAPSSLISARVARAGLVVARSVQPDLRYLACGLFEGLRFNTKGLAAMAARVVLTAHHAVLVMLGWHRAAAILCLGQLERRWMERRFPLWKTKLASYVSAPSDADRDLLQAVAQHRGELDPSRPVRFLWLGRWSRHKGTRRLRNFMCSWLDDNPQDSFTIAGCGDAAASVLPKALIASGRVKIVARYDRKELARLLGAHDVGLFTSLVEGWGLTLNEMLESGLPVFATEAGGVADLRPYFRDRLRPFPPSRASIDQCRSTAAPDWSAYRSRFGWVPIALGYQEFCLEVLRRERRGCGRQPLPYDSARGK